MAKQKKIIDLKERKTHLICIQSFDPAVVNPYSIYAIISPPGYPIRKRLLIRYGEFMSVLYFLIDFYRNGLDAIPVCEAQQWIKDHTA